MVILGNKRQPDESYEDYRQRLKDERQYIKKHLKGKIGHISKPYWKAPIDEDKPIEGDNVKIVSPKGKTHVNTP